MTDSILVPCIRRLMAGPPRWGRIAPLIETCRLNGVEPYAWLKGTLEKVAAGYLQSRIRELLPWAYGPPSN